MNHLEGDNRKKEKNVTETYWKHIDRIQGS